jgi:hypothetical protein
MEEFTVSALLEEFVQGTHPTKYYFKYNSDAPVEMLSNSHSLGAIV